MIGGLVFTQRQSKAHQLTNDLTYIGEGADALEDCKAKATSMESDPGYPRPSKTTVGAESGAESPDPMSEEEIKGKTRGGRTKMVGGCTWVPSTPMHSIVRPGCGEVI